MPVKKSKSKHGGKVARQRKAKKSPRATVTTKNHAPGAHPLAGSEERRLVLTRDALQLKLEGYSLTSIAEQLANKYQLSEKPGTTTVYDWIESALAEGRMESKRETENYIRLAEHRAESIIRALMPFAAGEFKVERKKMQDGEEITVIDEDVMRERVAAADAIRKQIEMVMKARGVGRAETEDGGKVSEKGMQTFILQSIHNHLAQGGEVISVERQQTVLELEAGDSIIDSL